MRKIITALALFVGGTVSVHAQWLLDAEVAVGLPLMFGDARADFGLETRRPQPGFRLGLGTYIDKNSSSPRIFTLVRYTHLFPVTLEASLEVSGNSYQKSMTDGTCRMTYNNVIPQIGWRGNGEGARDGKWHKMILLGLGLSWARTEYNMPDFDEQTMSYFNPPWYRSNKKNEVGKVYGMLPGLMLTYGTFYSGELLDIFVIFDAHFVLGDYPPIVPAVSGGIQFPIGSLNFVEK